MNANRLLLMMMVLIYFSCDQNKPTLIGIPIKHNTHYMTTPKIFTNYTLHSWMNDTIYRNCGYEFVIEPKDFSDQYKLEVEGGTLIMNGMNRLRFLVQSHEEALTLIITDNKNNIDIIEYVCPELPAPVLKLVETVDDSVIYKLEQPNKRLAGILPKDTRYFFKSARSKYPKITVHKNQKDNFNFNAIRLNYRNQLFDVLPTN